MSTVHKASNQSGFLVTRQLKVSGLDPSRLSSLVEELNHSPSVDFAEYLSKGNKIRVTYDASHWSIDDLISLIENDGGRLARGWWQKRKLGWYRYTDDNVRSSAVREPVCCSKIPPMKRK